MTAATTRMVRAAGVVLTGELPQPTDFGAGPLPANAEDGRDWFVARFDAAGEHLHSFSMPAEGVQASQRVASAPTGETVLSGHYQGGLTLGSVVLPDAGVAEDAFAAVFSK